MIVSSQDINLLLWYLVLLDLKFLIPRHDDGVHDNGVHDDDEVHVLFSTFSIPILKMEALWNIMAVFFLFLYYFSVKVWRHMQWEMFLCSRKEKFSNF